MRELLRGWKGRTALLAAVVVATVATAGGIWAFRDRERDPATSAKPQAPARAPRRPRPPAPVPPPRVEIPRIGVRAHVVSLGLTRDRRLEVPTNFDQAGWWSGGARPGNPGAAV